VPYAQRVVRVMGAAVLTVFRLMLPRYIDGWSNQVMGKGEKGRVSGWMKRDVAGEEGHIACLDYAKYRMHLKYSLPASLICLTAEMKT